VTPVLQYDDEADPEYREAGQWYDVRQPGLGPLFFDEVDAAIRRIAEHLASARAYPARPKTCRFGVSPFTAFRIP